MWDSGALPPMKWSKMGDEGVWAIMGTIDDINSHVGITGSLEAGDPMGEYQRS